MPSIIQTYTTGRNGLMAGGAALLIAIGAWYWFASRAPSLPDGFAASNGRIEAEQVDVATKYAGRVDEIRVEEGDFVTAGQVLAWMDDAHVKAEVAAAVAEVHRAEQQKAQAEAAILQREAELDLAGREFDRAEKLSVRGNIPTEQLDRRRAQKQTAQAALATVKAGKAAAQAVIEAAEANLAHLRETLDDLVLKATRSGRVQYRLAEPGEVLAPGGRVLTLLDLSDVYMTIFLPASEAGLLVIGGDARLILDPIPDFVIPAHVSFVATDAQFTPKSVETREERENLMFRVKLSIEPKLLARVATRIKTGVRGTGYVQTASVATWPDWLAVRLPAIAQSNESPDDPE
tara:strand:- start:3855 stop:4895 length:1041 start_codon:yes stop_codon:yes gene_type:complete